MNAYRLALPCRATLIRGALVASVSSIASAPQRQDQTSQRYFLGPNDFFVPSDFNGNPAYDGRVTFVRLKYRGGEHWYGGERGGAGWAHDYPLAQTHFAQIMLPISTMRPFLQAPPAFRGAIPTPRRPMPLKLPITRPLP